MSLEQQDRNKFTPESLSDLSGEPIEEFEYDEKIPAADEQDWDDATKE